MLLGIKKKIKSPDELSLREFHSRRNKVLITRDARGIGDILCARMLFANVKKAMPNAHVTFACYKQYLPLLNNHPFLDEAVDVKTVDVNQYGVSYDISKCCIIHESKEMGNNKLHRAEIWADHCGVPLTDHDMHLPLISKEKMIEGHLAVKQLRMMATSEFNKDGPSVLFSPLAFDLLRSLTLEQTKWAVDILRDKGLFVYATHQQPVELYKRFNIPAMISRSYEDWFSYIHAADYVVTVDTSNFHYAGAIKKPLTGIFTHVDGKLRGKFYDFVLVQKHRDNGDWPCGPCYNYIYCTHEDCKNPRDPIGGRPCQSHLTKEEIEDGVTKMLKKWRI